MIRTKQIAGAVVMTAIAVGLSPFFIPAGVTKVYPFQHMVNAISGIFLGPVYAVVVAIAAGILRNMLGTGTIFAFPGGIPGALVVGLIYHYFGKNDHATPYAPWLQRIYGNRRKLWERDYAALTESIGTAIGAIFSGLIVAPMIGREMTTMAFLIAFLASSIPGAILGFIIVKGLRKSGFTGFD